MWCFPGDLNNMIHHNMCITSSIAITCPGGKLANWQSMTQLYKLHLLRRHCRGMHMYKQQDQSSTIARLPASY